MNKFFFLVFLFFSFNIYASDYNFKSDNYSQALIDIATQSEDMKEYLKYSVNEKFFNKYIIIQQNNSIYIKTPKFNKDDSIFIRDIFSSYCIALGGKLSGGEFLINETVNGDKIIYTIPFNCFDDVNKKLLFKSETDGSKVTTPTYIEVVATPDYVRKNLIDATAKISKAYLKESADTGFFGSDGKENYVVYFKDKKRLFFRYKNSRVADPFIEFYSDIVGYINYGYMKNYYPLFDIKSVSLKGDDCKSKEEGQLFIYPEGYCEITYNNVIFPTLNLNNINKAELKTGFGKFIIYPMLKE